MKYFFFNGNVCKVYKANLYFFNHTDLHNFCASASFNHFYLGAVPTRLHEPKPNLQLIQLQLIVDRISAHCRSKPKLIHHFKMSSTGSGSFNYLYLFIFLLLLSSHFRYMTGTKKFTLFHLSALKISQKKVIIAFSIQLTFCFQLFKSCTRQSRFCTTKKH